MNVIFRNKVILVDLLKFAPLPIHKSCLTALALFYVDTHSKNLNSNTFMSSKERRYGTLHLP